MKKFILVFLLAIAAATPATAFNRTSSELVEDDYLQYILEAAAKVWCLPEDELTYAYANGEVGVEELSEVFYYRVTYGGSSAIVCIEDSL